MLAPPIQLQSSISFKLTSLSLSSSAPKNLMKLTNRVFIEQSEFLIFDTIKIQSTSIKLTFFKEWRMSSQVTEYGYYYLTLNVFDDKSSYTDVNVVTSNYFTSYFRSKKL